MAAPCGVYGCYNCVVMNSIDQKWISKMIQNWKSKYRRRSFKGPAPASQIILLNTERGDTETANSLARNEETYFGMILWLFLSRAPEHYHIVSKDGNCRKYISLCQRKNPNKFSLHSIEKPNDTQGSFGAIWRIPLTKSFSSSIRIKTNSKDEDIQVPMCTNWTPPEWSYTCSGLFQ